MYLIILIIIIIIYIIVQSLPIYKEVFKNICESKLTDCEYLEHMIQHHQVAIDISKILQKKTKWVELHKILRELIWIQETEIEIMNMMLYSMPDRISDSTIKMNTIYERTLSDFIKPNKVGLTNTYCDPLFFDPKKHMQHLSHITDDYYIEHMIPHHQVAIDMSKILLKNTDKDMMIWLAYRIIKDQQQEVFIFDNLKKSKYRYESELVL